MSDTDRENRALLERIARTTELKVEAERLDDMLVELARGAVHNPDAETAYEDALISRVVLEMHLARRNWQPFNSAHEGHSVMREEFEELWDHVKVNQRRRDLGAMRKEAIQVAAMAIRFALDVCTEERGRK